MDDNAIDILLRLTDELSPALAKAQAQVRETALQLANTGEQGSKAFKALEDAASKWLGVSKDGKSIVEDLIGAFAVERLFEFAKGAVEAAARLEDLKLATGISTDGLQQLAYVGKEFGVDMEQIAKGVEQLSAKLAGGDKSATAAVELLGLNVRTLLEQGPQEAFVQIADAAGRIDDPMTKSAIAAELFGGRLAKQLLPMLGDVRDRMNEVPKDAIISDANIAKAHEFEVGLDHLETKLKSWTVSVVGVASTYNTWLESGTGLTGFLDMLHGKTVVGTKDLDDHKAATETSADATLHLTQTVKDKIEADALAAEKLKAFTAAMVEVDAVGVGWKGTLNTISGSVVEAIRYYLEAGVAQDKLATAYGLTAAQVKAVGSALKDETEQLKVQAAATEQVTKIWDEFNQIASKGGTAFDDQVASIDRWAEDLEAKAQKAGTDTKEFYDALTALWSAKLHQAALSTEQAVQDVGEAARSVFAEMNDDVMGITSDFDGWNDAIMNVKQSLDGTIQSAKDLQKAHDAGNSLDVGHAARDPEIMELLKTGWSLENAESIKLGRQWGYQPKLYDNKGNLESAPSKDERVPGYKDGVLGAPGGWSMVGEAGPEMMFVPPGADIYKNGAGPSGTTVVQHIYITQPLGTPTQIAKAFDSATIQRQKNIGVRY